MGLFIIEANADGNIIGFCFWILLAATESELIRSRWECM